MKILRHPPALENWYVKLYCTNNGHGAKGCGAKLKIYRNDLRFSPPLGTGDVDDVGAVTFKCICCGVLTDIGMQDYPENHKKLKPYKSNWLTPKDEHKAPK